MTARAGEHVMLVHGMGRTSASMVLLARALEREGYVAHRFGYASRTSTVREAAERLAAHARAIAGDRTCARLHFVGHSLGNILIRWVMHNDRPSNAGRIVMLAPPNQGSSVADRLADGWAGTVLRPLAELTTRATSTARAIPPPSGIEFGVIAGDRDNKVSVAETHLEGEADHVIVESGHTFIMARPAVHRLILRFLETGSFGTSRGE
jgi:triacylglycerol lipase